MYLAKEFSHFEAGIQYKNGFKRNIYLTLRDLKDFIQVNKDHGLFTTAYRYDREDIRDANMIGNLYIDFDNTDIEDGDNFEKLREDVMKTISAFGAIFGIRKESIKIYFSGNKGVHLIIPAEIMGIKPHPELNMVFKLIAKDMSKLIKNQTIDTQIYDKVRLFRVPNSIHPKTNLYKVPITFAELKNNSLQELQKTAEKPRGIKEKETIKLVPQASRIYQDYVKEWEDEKIRQEQAKKKKKKKSLNFRPACIDHLWQNGVKEGQRNNTIAALASYMMQRGINMEDTIDYLTAYNEEMISPSLPGREVEKTIKSIFYGEHRYGCAAFRELSICDPNCPIYKM